MGCKLGHCRVRVLWIVTSMAVIAIHVIPYIHVKVQPPGVKEMSPQMLLPAIAVLTSAAAGGGLCVYGALNPALQGPVIVVAYLEIGAGLLLAICMVDIFQSRLINRGFPSIEHVYEDMILCGPFGQGSYALLIIGKAIRNNVSSSNASRYNLDCFLTTQSAGALGIASQFAGCWSGDMLHSGGFTR
jgi:tellurite resistance protein TehA-like permease